MVVCPIVRDGELNRAGHQEAGAVDVCDDERADVGGGDVGNMIAASVIVAVDEGFFSIKKT